MQEGQRTPIKILLTELDSSDAIKCSAALGQLRERSKEHVPLLKDPSDPIRIRAAQACVEVFEMEAVPSLISMLRDESSQMRVAAIRALEDLRAVKAGPEIVKMLQDQDEDVRLQAAFAIKGLRIHTAIQALRSVLRAEK